MAWALGLDSAPAPGVHTEILLLEVYPYASVYVGAEGMMGGEAADRIAGFWRVLGATPPPEPDHLASVCGLYASLLDAEWERDKSEGGGPGSGASGAGGRSDSPVSNARRAFLWEHMVPWIPLFSQKVEQVARRLGSEAGPLAAWAALLLEALVAEASPGDASPGDRAAEGSVEGGGAGRRPMDRTVSLHLREAGPGLTLGDPDDGGSGGVDDVSAHLMVPLRTGIVLARSDLALAASSLGVGARAGERRFMLRSLLEQEPEGVLAWLGDEAEAWQHRHAALVPLLGYAASFWEARATTSSRVLRAASRAAGKVQGGASD